jgi:hypothetical protein
MPNRHLAQSKRKKPLLKKARVTEKDDVKDIVVAAARKVLVDIQQRSTEAIKALDQRDFLVVLGALAGLEEQIRFLTVRFMVLREVEQIQKQKSEEGGNHDGSEER